jgi:hypothetical protein
MAGIRLVQRVNERERAGDAGGALDIIEGAPRSPTGGAMWTKARVSRLVEVATFGPLLPPWAVARWIRSQALGHLGRPGSREILAAYGDARRARLGGVTGARASADPIEAQCQVADHDWVFAQSYLHEHHGLQDFLTGCSPDLVARAPGVEGWAGQAMGAFRLARDDATTITWHDLGEDREVRTLNLGAAATLHPGDHVIGRRVTSGGEWVFDGAPLAVPEQVAAAVGEEPSAWVAALGGRDEQSLGPRVRPGSWRGGPSGLLTDLPDKVWEDIALGHRELDEDGRASGESGDPLLEGCVELVLQAVEAPIWLAPHDPVRDPWPVVAAAWQHPGVFEILTSRLDRTFDPLEVAAAGRRMGGVARRLSSLMALSMLERA